MWLGVCIGTYVVCTCALCVSARWETVSLALLMVGPRDAELSTLASPRLFDPAVYNFSLTVYIQNLQIHTYMQNNPE